MAQQISALTPIDPFPSRVLPQDRFDQAVRTNMSQLSGMIGELNASFIPSVNTISTQVENNASTASTAATNASNSATTATNKATEATTAASTATTKASQASTSATNAANSATAAANSAAQAAQTLSNLNADNVTSGTLSMSRGGTGVSATEAIDIINSIGIGKYVNSGSYDFDDLRLPGVYGFGSSATLTNCPNGTNGTLLVFSSGDQVQQIWHRKGTYDSNDYVLFFRQGWVGGGQWSSWNKIITDAVFQKEAITLAKTLTITQTSNAVNLKMPSTDARGTLPTSTQGFAISMIDGTTSSNRYGSFQINTMTNGTVRASINEFENVATNPREYGVFFETSLPSTNTRLFRPSLSNSISLGSSNYYWKGIYSNDAFINGIVYLSRNNGTPTLKLKREELTKGTAPSGNAYQQILFTDKNDNILNHISSCYTTAKKSFILLQVNNSANADSTGNNGVEMVCNSDGSYEFTPQGTNNVNLGSASLLWKQLFASTATISTSDERIKAQITDIPDEVLDAWGEVQWSQYKFNDALKEKGDSARLHTGTVAQRIMNIFQMRNLNAADYGLFCHDEWPAEDWDETIIDKEAVTEMVKVVDQEAQYDNEGNEISPEVSHEEERIIEPEVSHIEHHHKDAGDLYSLRYEECFAMEASWQRREVTRLKGRLETLEKVVAGLQK